MSETTGIYHPLCVYEGIPPANPREIEIECGEYLPRPLDALVADYVITWSKAIAQENMAGFYKRHNR